VYQAIVIVLACSLLSPDVITEDLVELERDFFPFLIRLRLFKRS